MTTQAKVPAAVPVAESTESPPQSTTQPPMAAADAPVREKRKFTVAEYYKMAEVGILGPEERVELIEGEIIVMPPIGPGHAWRVDLTADLITRRLDERYIVRNQNPIHLNDGSEPQPDVIIMLRRRDGYGAAHPTPADVLLVIEVADSSLAFDRNVKAHLYGRNGVPETWVKNLPEDCIERFTEPGPEGYGQHTIHRRGESITPVLLPDLEFAVEDLLPASPVQDGDE